MIITNSDFYGEFYLPQAKPSLVPENSVSEKVTDYIEEYSFECILRCFGYVLAEEFASKIDDSQPNGLIVGAEQKWDDLLNGKSYVKDGKDFKWRGLKFVLAGTQKVKSLIVPYVFYKFQSHIQTTSSPTGEKKVRSKGSEIADASYVLSRSWNKFVDQVQKKQPDKIYIQNTFGLGVDYYNSNVNQYVTLNEFIMDTNNESPDTYENYNPEIFKRIDSLGIS